ncbi:MAG: ABC transporter permease [Sarcina sp.]
MKKYTDLVNRQIRVNKKKTMLSSLGIMVGIILLTFVLIFSRYSTLRESNGEKAINGEWEVSYNITNDYNKKLDQIKNNTLVKNVGVVATQTYSEQKIGDNIINVDLHELDNTAINEDFKTGLEAFGALKDFPSNNNEVLLGENAKSLGLKVGQNIKFGEKDYKIIGFFNENQTGGLGKIIALTKLNKINLDSNVRAYMNISGTATDILNNINSVKAGLGYKQEVNSEGSQIYDENFQINEANIQNEFNVKVNSETQNGTNAMDISMIVVVILISVVINYGLINFTLADKVKQFGVLRCMGATPKQIRTIVYKDVLYLGIISIIPGVLFGYLGVMAVIKFMSVKYDFKSFGVSLGLYPLILMAILIISILSILIGALRPALRAGSISPMEGIRSGKKAEVKIKKRNSKFIRKVFGIEGDIAYKNLLAKPVMFWTSTILLSLCFIIFVTFTTYISMTIKSKKDELKIGKEVQVQVYTQSKHLGYQGEPTKEQKAYEDKANGVELYNKSVIEKERIMKFLDSKGLKSEVATDLTVPRILNLFVETDKKLSLEFLKINENDGLLKEVTNLNGKKEILSAGRVMVYNDKAFDMIKGKVKGDDVNLKKFNDNGIIIANAKQVLSEENSPKNKVLEVPLFENIKSGEKMNITFADGNNDISMLDNLTPTQVSEVKGDNKSVEVSVLGTIPYDDIISNNGSNQEFSIIISDSFFKKHYKEIIGDYKGGISVDQKFLFDFKSDIDRENNINSVKEYFELNHGSYVKDNVEQVRDLKNVLGMIVTGSYGGLAVTLIVLLSSIIISKNLNVSVRKKEFGTLLAIGMAKKSIKKSILLEAILQFIVVVGISIPITLILNQIVIKSFLDFGVVESGSINIYLVIGTVIATFIINIFTSLIPLRKFKKLDMVDMMREEE